MPPKAFIDHIEREAVRSVYLFIGGSELLIDEAWSLLLEKLIPPNARKFNGERIQAKDHSAAQVISRLSTLPMFGAKQLLMVQNIEDWPKEQKSALQSYLEHPHPTSCLVRSASQKKGLDKLESAVASVGMVLHLSAPSEREMPEWLKERARRFGKTLTQQAAVRLFEEVGGDLRILEREIEKLVAYVGEKSRIDIEDVMDSASSQRAYSVFELLNYVGRRQSREAIASLRKLILAGESPIAIVSLLARQIRIVWQVKDAMERRQPVTEIARQLNLPTFVIKGYAQQAPHFTEAELSEIHKALRETDFKLKSTGTAPVLLLEGLVLGLCGKGRG
jgi:DNA polymerase III subunit delta